jgi:hypothetical protein
MTEPSSSYDNDVSVDDVDLTDDATRNPADTDLPDFELTADDGNVRVDRLVRQVAAIARAGEIERREAIEALSDGLRDISAEHPDATDITVRDAIIRELRPVFAAAGWEIPEPFEF